MRVKVIGIGGIGGCLLPVLCKFLDFKTSDKVTLVLVDGDSYETKNLDRQFFDDFGNKAEVTLSLIHISEPTRQKLISYAVFCLKKIFFNDTATTEIYT